MLDTRLAVTGCGFNVIFAGNTLKHFYVTEKCIGSSGISIYGKDYQGGKQPNINFELTGNTLCVDRIALLPAHVALVSVPTFHRADRHPPAGLNVRWDIRFLCASRRYDTEGLRVIGGDSDNATISMGHIVRKNRVVDKIDPPEPWLGPDPKANPDWRSSRNMLSAIEIGISKWADSHALTPWYSHNHSCFQDIVVEDNEIVVRRGNGTCDRNGYGISAEHTTDRNNKCSVSVAADAADEL